MERLSKDITLPNLHHYLLSSSSPPPPPLLLQHHQLPPTTSFHGLILRGFLSGAFKDPHDRPLSPYPVDLSLSRCGLLSPILPRKRAAEQPPDPSGTPDSSEDRRQKRLMKNREAEARSRARKQAYTSELETEIALLAQENASLKKQQYELRKAMAAQTPSKCKLQRASSL